MSCELLVILVLKNPHALRAADLSYSNYIKKKNFTKSFKDTNLHRI